jgi:succinoglycan biosynthesis transport protein ExoP
MAISRARRGRDLRLYLTLIRRYSGLLVLCAALGAASGFIVSKRQAPVYQANTILLVDYRNVGQDTYTGVQASSQLATTYASMVPQPVVIQRAAQDRGISVAQLEVELSVIVLPQTQMIQIQINDTSPTRAAQLADAVAAAFIALQQQTAQEDFDRKQQQLDQDLAQTTSQIDKLTSQIASLKSQNASSPDLQALQQQLDTALAHRSAQQSASADLVTQELAAINAVRVFQPAVPPTEADHPKPLIYSVEGGALALVVALALVILLQALDDRVRKEEDVTDLLRLPTLGNIGSEQRRASDVIAGGEEFRLLRTNLSYLSLEGPLRTIAITSLLPDEASMITAIGLAISLAQGGKRVLLVDADLRRPTIHTIMRLPNDGGLSQLLVEDNPDTSQCEQFAQLPSIPNLRVLTAGPTPPNPTEVLGSRRMHQFLTSLLAGGQSAVAIDMVILAASPVLDTADGLVVAGEVDGVILVLDTRRARTNRALAAKAALQRINAKILGVVLSSVTRQHSTGAYLHATPKALVGAQSISALGAIRESQTPSQPNTEVTAGIDGR